MVAIIIVESITEEVNDIDEGSIDQNKNKIQEQESTDQGNSKNKQEADLYFQKPLIKSLTFSNYSFTEPHRIAKTDISKSITIFWKIFG